MHTADRLFADMQASLKAGTSDRTGVLRLLIAEIKNKEKEKQAKTGSPALTEEEVIAVLQKESKKRKEAIELFRKGGREDLARTEEAELVVIGGYVPAPMSDDEVRAVVERMFSRGSTDFNSLIRESMKELKGKVDGARLAQIIKERLG